MNKKQIFSLLAALAALLFGLAVSAYLLVIFFVSGEGEVFHWLSFDGIETWGTKYDLLPLAIFNTLSTAICAVMAVVFCKKQKLNSCLTIGIVSAIFTFLFLLAGLNFR